VANANQPVSTVQFCVSHAQRSRRPFEMYARRSYEPSRTTYERTLPRNVLGATAARLRRLRGWRSGSTAAGVATVGIGDQRVSWLGGWCRIRSIGSEPEFFATKGMHSVETAVYRRSPRPRQRHREVSVRSSCVICHSGLPGNGVRPACRQCNTHQAEARRRQHNDEIAARRLLSGR